MKPILLLRAAALGLASGGRSTAGVAALAVTDRRRPRWVAVAVLAVAGELVGDKLPQAPSRLEPAGLGARLVTGAASALLLARRERVSLLPAVVLGAAAAATGAHLGAVWRAWAGVRTGRDAPGAVVEDVLCLGVALAAARG